MKTKWFKIVEKQDLVPQIELFRIQAPLISSKFQPGQFVVIRINQ